jgi:hypothetical protein
MFSSHGVKEQRPGGENPDCLIVDYRNLADHPIRT